jgi:hypothetical protein
MHRRRSSPPRTRAVSVAENREGAGGVGRCDSRFLPAFLCQPSPEFCEGTTVTPIQKKSRLREKGARSPGAATLGTLGIELHNTVYQSSTHPRLSKASNIRSNLIVPVGNTGTVFGLRGMGVSLKERDIEEERLRRADEIQEERKHETRLRPLTGATNSRSTPGLPSPAPTACGACASSKPMHSGAQQRIHRNPKKCAEILTSLGFACAPPLEAAGKFHLETGVPEPQPQDHVPAAVAASDAGRGVRMDEGDGESDEDVDRIVGVAAQVRTALFDAGMRFQDLLWGPGGVLPGGGEVSGEDRQVLRVGRATSAKYKRPATASSPSRESTCTRQQTRVANQSAHQSNIAHQSRSRHDELRPMEPDFHFLEEHDGQHDETDQPMSPTRAVQSQVASSISPVVALCAHCKCAFPSGDA